MTVISLGAASSSLPAYQQDESDLTAFNPHQVELLLNQSAELLDRVWSDLKHYNALRADQNRLAIELANESADLAAAKTSLFDSGSGLSGLPANDLDRAALG